MQIWDSVEQLAENSSVQFHDPFAGCSNYPLHTCQSIQPQL